MEPAALNSSVRRKLETKEESQAKKPCFESNSKTIQVAKTSLPLTTPTHLPQTPAVSAPVSDLDRFLATLNLEAIQTSCDYFQALTSGHYKESQTLTVDRLRALFETQTCFANAVEAGKLLLEALSKKTMPPFLDLSQTLQLLHQAQFLGVKEIEANLCSRIQKDLTGVDADTFLDVLAHVSLPHSPQIALTLLDRPWFQQLDDLFEESPRFLSKEAAQLIEYCKRCCSQVKDACYVSFDYRKVTIDDLITRLLYCPHTTVLQMQCCDIPYSDASADPYWENEAIFTDSIEAVLALETITTLWFSTDCLSENLFQSLGNSNLEKLGIQLYPRRDMPKYEQKLMTHLLDVLESNPSIKEVAVLCEDDFKDVKESRPFKLLTGKDAAKFMEACK